MPKGWPIDGLDAPAAAAQEAWEEAGVRPASIKPRAVGRFDYMKRLNEGLEIPVEAKVYKIKVADLAETFPEAGTRERRWVTANDAANMVAEPGLREILKAF